MQFEETEIKGVTVVMPKRIDDRRGFFSETYKRDALAKAGFRLDFIQDNHSLSADVGTVRGLHFQSSPYAQDKLVRVVRGRILDVVVDIRRSSATYGRHVAVELSAENWKQLLIETGLAHGFCTLEPDTEVIYKVTAPYAPANDFGLAWDDPALGIRWPVGPEQAILSEKDRRHPTLADLPAYFG